MVVVAVFAAKDFDLISGSAKLNTKLSPVCHCNDISLFQTALLERFFTKLRVQPQTHKFYALAYKTGSEYHMRFGSVMEKPINQLVSVNVTNVTNLEKPINLICTC